MGVSMDNGFIVIGQADGEVAAVYAKNGATVFKTKVSEDENKITAVCADETADYFYAGDDQGNLYVLDKKRRDFAEWKHASRGIRSCFGYLCCRKHRPSFCCLYLKRQCYIP